MTPVTIARESRKGRQEMAVMCRQEKRVAIVDRRRTVDGVANALPIHYHLSASEVCSDACPPGLIFDSLQANFVPP